MILIRKTFPIERTFAVGVVRALGAEIHEMRNISEFVTFQEQLNKSTEWLLSELEEGASQVWL